MFKKAGYKADGVKMYLFCFLKGVVNAIEGVSVGTDILRRFFFAPSQLLSTFSSQLLSTFWSYSVINPPLGSPNCMTTVHTGDKPYRSEKDLILYHLYQL